jgi:hypothetical protein
MRAIGNPRTAQARTGILHPVQLRFQEEERKACLVDQRARSARTWRNITSGISVFRAFAVRQRRFEFWVPQITA